MKVRISLVCVFLLLITSCVTRPYTIDDYNKLRKAPLSTSKSLVIGLVPGLPQLLNGEYLEAGIYFTGFSAPLIVNQVLQKTVDTESEAGQTLMKSTAAVCLSFYGVSYVDGVLSSVIRTNQYKSIRSEDPDYIMMKEKEKIEQNKKNELKKIEEERKKQEKVSFAEKLQQMQSKLKNDKIELLKKKWPNLSGNEIEAVYNKQIFIGMSRDGLLASWGKPEDINSSVGSWGKHEQFVYPGKNDYESVYVYVDNGYITSWQD